MIGHKIRLHLQPLTGHVGLVEYLGETFDVAQEGGEAVEGLAREVFAQSSRPIVANINTMVSSGFSTRWGKGGLVRGNKGVHESQLRLGGLLQDYVGGPVRRAELAGHEHECHQLETEPLETLEYEPADLNAANCLGEDVEFVLILNLLLAYVRQISAPHEELNTVRHEDEL